MDVKRQTYKAYLVLLHLDAQGKNNWVSKVRLTLFRFGFGYVLQNNGVQAINVFVRCFKQRLIDNRWQDWNSRIDESDRFSFYRQFKTNHIDATYLSVDINKRRGGSGGKASESRSKDPKDRRFEPRLRQESKTNL